MTIVFLLITALLSSCIELEISAPGFPCIAEGFSISEAATSGLVTYNLLGFCLAALFWGSLSERYGRRPCMILGNGILALGALGCVLAPTFEFMLAARFIQGIGAATSAVIVSAIIADLYNQEKAARLYGIMNAVFSTLMAISPIAGGFITEAIGYKGVFSVVAAICTVSWLLLLFLLPETLSVKSKQDISHYRKVLSSWKFLQLAIVPSLLYGCYLTFVSLAPFVYMTRFLCSMTEYTLHQGTVVFCFAIASSCYSTISRHFGIRSALSICFIASILMSFTENTYLLTGLMSLFSVGFALIYPPMFAASLEVFPNFKGVCSSVIMSLRYLLCSVITWTGGVLYEGSPSTIGVILFSVMLAVVLSFGVRLLNYKGIEEK
jgi:DHA1 family bicyclomycin/chloramphenicol resistance-like MFS transporter